MIDYEKGGGSKGKKVAIIGSPDLEFYGGTQVNVIHSAMLLKRLGYDVTIFGSGTYFERRDVELDAHIRYVRNAFPFSIFSRKSVLRVTRGVVEPLLGAISSKRIFSIVRGYDFYYFTAPKFIFNAVMKNLGTERVLLANHGTYMEFLSSRKIFFASALINLFDSIFLKYADGRIFIHVQNRFQMEHYIKRGFSGERIFLIPQCNVDFSRYEAKENDAFRVLFLNRLSRDKGAHLIPKIARMCGDIEFIVVGDGPLLEMMKSEASDNMKIKGFLTEEEKVSAVEECDVIINLSKYESLSISSIEGLAAGLIIISKEETSGLKFIGESVPDSVLFAGGGVEGVCSMIRRLKRDKESERAKFNERKRRRRERAMELFDAAIINKKMEDMFMNVFSGEGTTVQKSETLNNKQGKYLKE